MGERADDLRSNDPDEIHADIERTRGEMSGTIDEIQERLSPGRIQQQATERVREATIGRVEHAGESARETGMTMLETLKQNPIPAAMVGVGLGWLYMSRGGSSSGQRYDYGESRIPSGESERGAGQVAESATQRAEDMGGQMRERSEHMSSMARGQAQQMRGQFGQMFQENPLAIGVVAFGIGAALGLTVPESRKEHQIMGERRDELIDQAKVTAQDKMERAGNVAERAYEEARGAAEDEARRQDLTE